MKNIARNTVSIEQWNVKDEQKRYPSGRAVVTKIAVRDSKGRFHGATNFRGSVLGK